MFHAKNVRATGAYLTRGCDPRDPEASPVHADLTGFPPMLLFAGTRELFVDDARAHRAARRRRAASAPSSTCTGTCRTSSRSSRASSRAPSLRSPPSAKFVEETQRPPQPAGRPADQVSAGATS